MFCSSLVALLLVLCQVLPVSSQSLQFHPVSMPDGTPSCGVNSESSTATVVPGKAIIDLCEEYCIDHVTGCHHYNWYKFENGTTVCEVFPVVPAAYSVVPGCAHYTTAADKKFPTVPTKTVDGATCSFPFVNEKQLYFQCALQNASVAGDVGCMTDSGTWGTCAPPADYKTTVSAAVVSLPAISTTSLTTVVCVHNWIVIQQRTNTNLITFNTRTWADYRVGFGNFSGKGDFWYGNEIVYRLTNLSVTAGGSGYKMRVELCSESGDWFYSEYSSFSLSDEKDGYRVHAKGYTGTGGDPFSGISWWSWHQQNEMRFSTVDRDNDQWPGGLCGSGFGFWFNFCGYASPNNLQWGFSAGNNLRQVRMMIKKI